MTTSSTPAVIHELNRIGVPVEDLAKIEAMARGGADLAPARAALETFQERVHQAFRTWARSNHPDRARDETDRVHRNKALVDAIAFDKWVKTWKIRDRPMAPPPRAPRVGVRVHFGGVAIVFESGYGAARGSTTSATMSGADTGAWRRTGGF